jgi:hypothetical protein
MSASWVAGSVRARLLVAERRLDDDAARALGAASSLAEALVVLARTPYRRDVGLELGTVEAQRAVVEKTLRDLRLLAGWLPRDALGALRALAAWYELANLEDRIAYLAGAPLRVPFELGSLAVAWPRAADAQSLHELRVTLRASSWGDPGGETPAETCLGLRLAWARRVAADVPEARAWAAGAAALLLAREVFVVGLAVEALPLPAFRLLGRGWEAAGTFARFVEALPPDAAWALEGALAPEDLWRAEARFWARVEVDANGLLRTGVAGQAVVVGAVALLAADTRRVVAALGAAARRGLHGVEEVQRAAA